MLPTVLHADLRSGFSTGNNWLNSTNPSRPDWVSSTEQTDQDVVSIGCGSLFLNYLAYQLNFEWPAIINAAAPTLGETAAKLGVKNGFRDFASLLASHFPPGVAVYFQMTIHFRCVAVVVGTSHASGARVRAMPVEPPSLGPTLGTPEIKSHLPLQLNPGLKCCFLCQSRPQQIGVFGGSNDQREAGSGKSLVLLGTHSHNGRRKYQESDPMVILNVLLSEPRNDHLSCNAPSGFALQLWSFAFGGGFGRQPSQGLRLERCHSECCVCSDVSLCVHFLPSVVARWRKKSNLTAIFVLNLLAGWTLVGRVVAMVQAVMVEGKQAMTFNDGLKGGLLDSQR